MNGIVTCSWLRLPQQRIFATIQLWKNFGRTMLYIHCTGKLAKVAGIVLEPRPGQSDLLWIDLWYANWIGFTDTENAVLFTNPGCLYTFLIPIPGGNGHPSCPLNPTVRNTLARALRRQSVTNNALTLARRVQSVLHLRANARERHGTVSPAPAHPSNTTAPPAGLSLPAPQSEAGTTPCGARASHIHGGIGR